MALVQLSCPLCGGWFQVEDQYAGMQVACPHCQGAVLIPAELGGFGPSGPAPPSFGHAPPFEPPQEFSWRPPGESLPTGSLPTGAWPSEPPGFDPSPGPPVGQELPTGGLPTGSLPMGGAAPAGPEPLARQTPAHQTPPQKSAGGKTPRPAPRKANGPRPAVKKAGGKPAPAPQPAAARPAAKPKPETAQKATAAEKPRPAPQPNGEKRGEPSPAPRVSSAPQPVSSSSAEAAPQPNPADHKQPATADVKGESLPPPVAASADGKPPWPQAPAPLPEFDEALLPENPDQAYYDALFDPEKAALLRLKDPTTKVIHAGGEAIELRRLTPEEKAARRRMYNLVMVGFAALVLAVVIGISLSL